MRYPMLAVFLFVSLMLAQTAVSAGAASQNMQQNTPAAKDKLPYPDVPRITAEEVYHQMQKGNVVIIDTDNSLTYGAEHIKGAVNVTYDPTVDISSFDQRLQVLPGNKLLVFYCNCAHEEDSAPMAKEMWQLNYSRDMVKALKGGLNRWEQLRYPLAGTDLPDSYKVKGN